MLSELGRVMELKPSCVSSASNCNLSSTIRSSLWYFIPQISTSKIQCFPMNFLSALFLLGQICIPVLITYHCQLVYSHTTPDKCDQIPNIVLPIKTPLKGCVPLCYVNFASARTRLTLQLLPLFTESKFVLINISHS